MIAFRHKALSSLADLLRPTIWAQDALWGITPNSGSVSKKNKTWTRQINITHSCWGIFFQWYRLWYLTDILKTNLTKFAVIWVKRCQKARLSSPRSSKITVPKEKERRKRKSEKKEKRRRERKPMAALLVFIIATLEKEEKRMHSWGVLNIFSFYFTINYKWVWES